MTNDLIRTMARAHSASPRTTTPRSLSLLKYDRTQLALPRRPIRRVLVVLLLLPGGGKLLLMHCGDRLWRTALALLWQHRCMTYRLPEDRIVFAGQPGPSDPSRFTIRVRFNGKDQTITGVLRDDGKIIFTSSSGFSPWGLKRAGALTLPGVNGALISDRTLPDD